MAVCRRVPVIGWQLLKGVPHLLSGDHCEGKAVQTMDGWNSTRQATHFIFGLKQKLVPIGKSAKHKQPPPAPPPKKRQLPIGQFPPCHSNTGGRPESEDVLLLLVVAGHVADGALEADARSVVIGRRALRRRRLAVLVESHFLFGDDAQHVVPRPVRSYRDA